MFYSEWRFGIQNFEEARNVRKAVMVDELHLPEEKVFDWNDEIAAHLLIWDEGKIASTARMYPQGGDVYIDQVCVLPEFRKRLFGDLSVRLLLLKAQDTVQNDIVVLAPGTSENYLSRFGFKSTGKQDSEGRVEMRMKKEDVVFFSQCGDHH